MLVYLAIPLFVCFARKLKATKINKILAELVNKSGQPFGTAREYGVHVFARHGTIYIKQGVHVLLTNLASATCAPSQLLNP